MKPMHHVRGRGEERRMKIRANRCPKKVKEHFRDIFVEIDFGEIIVGLLVKRILMKNLKSI